MIVDPWGRIVAEADHDEPGVIVAEIDTAAVGGRAHEDPEPEERPRVLGQERRRRTARSGESRLVIRFSLHCDHGHAFDGWFRNNDDFDSQAERDLVSCPVCGSSHVSKALMAPAVSTGRKRDKIALAVGEEQKQVFARLKELSEKVRANADYVGEKFAEEARKIHFGEVEARGIYGEASPEEVRSLAEDGVEFMPIPVFPDDRN